MTEESKVDMVGLGLDCRRDTTDPDITHGGLWTSQGGVTA
jgi:hypothetical protein